MKKSFYLILCVMVAFVSVMFCACNRKTYIYCDGVVEFSGTALQGVSIKSSNKTIDITDSDGKFSFESQSKKIKIYPEKHGYYFEPAFAVVEEGEHVVNFEAKEILNLSGTLQLNKIIISPTYIVSYSDNYLYENNNKDCLKVFDISLHYAGQTYKIVDEQMFLYKNEDNEIAVNEEIEVDCGTQTQIGFLINTYFIYNYNESHTTYTEYSYLIISEHQNNGDLVNNQIIYSLIGINGKSNKFTFDITFVFDFEESNHESV